MRTVVDGRRVGNNDEACYSKYVAYFKRRGLNKRNVLHDESSIDSDDISPRFFRASLVRAPTIVWGASPLKGYRYMLEHRLYPV